MAMSPHEGLSEERFTAKQYWPLTIGTNFTSCFVQLVRLCPLSVRSVVVCALLSWSLPTVTVTLVGCSVPSDTLPGR